MRSSAIVAGWTQMPPPRCERRSPAEAAAGGGRNLVLSAARRDLANDEREGSYCCRERPAGDWM